MARAKPSLRGPWRDPETDKSRKLQTLRRAGQRVWAGQGRGCGWGRAEGVGGQDRGCGRGFQCRGLGQRGRNENPYARSWGPGEAAAAGTPGGRVRERRWPPLIPALHCLPWVTPSCSQLPGRRLPCWGLQSRPRAREGRGLQHAGGYAVRLLGGHCR